MTGVLQIGRERFVIRVGPDGLTAKQGDDSESDFHVTGTIPALRAAFIGTGDADQFETHGELTVTGDREAHDRLRSSFHAPVLAE